MMLQDKKKGLGHLVEVGGSVQLIIQRLFTGHMGRERSWPSTRRRFCISSRK